MGSRILVVDDSPTIRRVVSAILERAGYDPTLASDGEDAYEALSSGEVKADLILLDFVMPRMNGYQFCRALRANPELAMTPVVLMSAKSDRIRDQFVQQTNAIDAITKPFDAQALVAVVENALRRVNSGRASSARLPDIGEAEPSGEEPIELETRRTHVAHIVATKLAHIVTRTMTERPGASPGELAAVLTERLARDAILEMMEAVRDLSRSGDEGTNVLSGDLGVVPIGAVLQLLQVEAQSGVLVCRNGTAEVVATFRNGLIDLVQSRDAGDEFRLGRFFVEEGILTPDQIDEVNRRAEAEPTVDEPPPSRVNVRTDPPSDGLVSEPVLTARLPGGWTGGGKPPDTVRDDTSARAVAPSDPPPPVLAIPSAPAGSDPHVRATMPGLPPPRSASPLTEPAGGRRLLGSMLLALGKITDSQLRSALTRQSSELLYEVLRWPRGRFDFRVEPPTRAVTSAHLGLPVASVVMEGFRRVDEWRVLERTIGNFAAVLVRDDLALSPTDAEALPVREKAILDSVDGERTVRSIIAASHMSSFDACRILVQLLEARVLRRRTG